MLRQSKKTQKNYQRYYIYKITNPNGSTYIGATTDIEKRVKVYESDPRVYKNQTNLSKSIEKYGWSKHQLIILKTFEGNFSINELTDIEQNYILKEYMLDKKKNLNTIIKGISKSETAQARDI
jgi:group I intron endonuclease